MQRSVRSLRAFTLSLVALCLAAPALSGPPTRGEDTAEAPERRSERPNVLLILVDDLGFSDVGAYGGEIRTPHLDRLAKDGLRYVQFYNTGRCWPTRASILTGHYAQSVRRDKVPGVKSGAGGARPAWAKLLPERLASAGYRSYHSGKWHVDGMPLEGGFDRSYYVRDQNRFFSPTRSYREDRKLPAVHRDEGYYATVAIADHAVECLESHAREYPDRPFFHFLAFTAPHFPLHALPEDIERYRDTYLRDWEDVRRERWERQRASGLLDAPLSEVERDVGPPHHHPGAMKKLGPGEVNRPRPWSELTEEQRRFQATKMAIHAAMVDRMDREIGRVLDQLRRMEAYDDTLIFFLSDNGASAEILVRADGHDRKAAPGSAATHLCLGPGWSTTCNAPFRRHKTWVHEGGIATPLIVHWPAGIEARGEVRRALGHVIDLSPTILELAGLEISEAGDESIVAVPPAPGRSLVPTFSRDVLATVSHPAAKKSAPRELWWLHEGNRALRVGNWKLVASKNGPWELYDLHADRSETRNLVAQRADRAQTMAERWEFLWREIQATARGDGPDS